VVVVQHLVSGWDIITKPSLIPLKHEQHVVIRQQF